MGKHINTKVKCFKCESGFMTSKLKDEYEEYNCPKCNQSHIADYDEVNEVWVHTCG